MRRKEGLLRSRTKTDVREGYLVDRLACRALKGVRFSIGCFRDFLAVRDNVPQLVHVLEDVSDGRLGLALQEVFAREEERVEAQESRNAWHEVGAFASHEEHIESHHVHEIPEGRVPDLLAVFEEEHGVLDADELVLVRATNPLIDRVEVSVQALVFEFCDAPEEGGQEPFGVMATNIVPAVRSVYELEKDVWRAGRADDLECQCRAARCSAEFFSVGPIQVVDRVGRDQPVLSGREFFPVSLADRALDNGGVPTNRRQLPNTDTVSERVRPGDASVLERCGDQDFSHCSTSITRDVPIPLRPPEGLTMSGMGLPVPNEPVARRHHYVPRCWLAGFTETGENDGWLWVTDFSRQRQWPSTPDNAGHMRDFYRLADPAPHPVVVEQFFSVLEGQVAALLRSIDQERRRPNDDELDLLLQFIAFQWVRVPRFRPFALQVLDRILRERLVQKLQTRDTWIAALQEAGMDPDAPGAEYEGMKRFFESGEWNLTAETDWYLQRAFDEVEGVLGLLRERYWGMSFTHQGRLIASDNRAGANRRIRDTNSFRRAKPERTRRFLAMWIAGSSPGSTASSEIGMLRAAYAWSGRSSWSDPHRPSLNRIRNRKPKVTPQSLQLAVLCFGAFEDRVSGSASFQSARKASYLAFALALSPDEAYALPRSQVRQASARVVLGRTSSIAILAHDLTPAKRRSVWDLSVKLLPRQDSVPMREIGSAAYFNAYGALRPGAPALTLGLAEVRHQHQLARSFQDLLEQQPSPIGRYGQPAARRADRFLGIEQQLTAVCLEAKEIHLPVVPWRMAGNSRMPWAPAPMFPTLMGRSASNTFRASASRSIGIRHTLPRRVI